MVHPSLPGPCALAPNRVNWFTAPRPYPMHDRGHRIASRTPMERSLRHLALLLAVATGFSLGVRAVTTAAEPPPTPSGVRESAPLAGTLWVPDRSDARRATFDPRPLLWVPPGSGARSGLPYPTRPWRGHGVALAHCDAVAPPSC